MESGKLIATFEIPQYLREIEVSAKQRPKYYTFENNTIKAKGKKLLQKYIDPEFKNSIIVNNDNILPICLKYPYFIVEFKGEKPIGIYGHFRPNNLIRFEHSNTLESVPNLKLTPKQLGIKSKYYLYNVETKSIVIANETQAGKPKKIIIKGQDMYSGVLNEFTRAKIVNELKEDYSKKIIFGNLHKTKFLIENHFPVRIEMELIDTIKDYYDNTKEGNGRRWDVGNRCYPYLKTFVDFLVSEEVLPDDDRLHVFSEGYFFTPCERFEDRKLIFRIYSK